MLKAGQFICSSWFSACCDMYVQDVLTSFLMENDRVVMIRAKAWANGFHCLLACMYSWQKLEWPVMIGDGQNVETVLISARMSVVAVGLDLLCVFCKSRLRPILTSWHRSLPRLLPLASPVWPASRTSEPVDTLVRQGGLLAGGGLPGQQHALHHCRPAQAKAAQGAC